LHLRHISISWQIFSVLLGGIHSVGCWQNIPALFISIQCGFLWIQQQITSVCTPLALENICDDDDDDDDDDVMSACAR